MSTKGQVLPTADDIRGARAYLNWNQKKLANLVGVSERAILQIENKKSKPQEKTLQRITNIFQNAGIHFLFEGGFRSNQNLTQIYEGKDGIRHFFDDIYQEALHQQQEFLIFNVDEKKFIEAYEISGMGNSHRKRISGIKNFKKSKAIISTEDDNKYASPYIDYRYMAKSVLSDIPFYIYNNKLSIIIWDESPKFIVHQHKELADSYRKIFYFLWEKAQKTT